MRLLSRVVFLFAIISSLQLFVSIAVVNAEEEDGSAVNTDADADADADADDLASEIVKETVEESKAAKEAAAAATEEEEEEEVVDLDEASDATTTTTTTAADNTDAATSDAAPDTTATAEDTAAAATKTKEESAPIQKGPLIDIFGPTLYSIKMIDESRAKIEAQNTNEALDGKKVIGLYFSADWYVRSAPVFLCCVSFVARLFAASPFCCCMHVHAMAQRIYETSTAGSTVHVWRG